MANDPKNRLELRQRMIRQLAQAVARRIKVRQHAFHHLPKARAVVHFAQVREFVRDHVIDHVLARVHQALVQAR
jgi:hypothetical protein